MLENETRAENVGAQHVHWVAVTVGPRDPTVFRFEQRLVGANRFPP